MKFIHIGRSLSTRKKLHRKKIIVIGNYFSNRNVNATKVGSDYQTLLCKRVICCLCALVITQK